MTIEIPRTELSVIPASTLPTILAADTTDILGRIKRRVDGCTRDASTEGGRDEIRSVAYDVTRAKMDLIRLGKSLTEGWRSSTAAVNAECKAIEERMTALQEAVRAPLTARENMEKDRVAGHESALAGIPISGGQFAADTESAAWAARLAYFENFPTRDWQEFAVRAHAEIDQQISLSRAGLAVAVKREADAAELTRLRAREAEEAAARAEQERIDREARIAAEAADNAKRDAEALAAAQAATAAREAREREVAATERERQAQALIARMEQDRIDAIAKAERDRLDAAEKSRLAAIVQAEKAARETREAIAEERRRAKADADRRQAEEDARAANIAHRTVVNRDALAGVIAAADRWNELIVDYAGGKEDLFKAIITAIAKGEVPHVTINY